VVSESVVAQGLDMSIVKRRPESAESKSITVTDHTAALMTMLDARAARSLDDRARCGAARPTSQAGTCSPTRSNAPTRRGASASSTIVRHIPERHFGGMLQLADSTVKVGYLESVPECEILTGTALPLALVALPFL
jgi:hypothetical protein